MSTAKHSPGPWFLLDAGKTLQVSDSQNHRNPDAIVHWQGFDCGDKPWKVKRANARLIAAAPDLLEALQDLFGADMEHVLMGDGKDDQIEAIAKGRAAIAKALG